MLSASNTLVGAYDIHKINVGDREICFIPMNVTVTPYTVQWRSSAQMATPFACSYNIFYIYQAFILLFHKSLHIHYPVNTSSDHFHTDAVVPSSDHCPTEIVLPSAN